MTRYDVLINFTGGLDSTYYLYTWLKNNPTKKALVHHCILKNYQLRFDKEIEACNKIIEWLRNQGLTNFEYIETTFDASQVISTINDIEIVGFMNSVILRSNRIAIDEIAITASAQDLTQGPAYDQRSKSRFEIIKLVSRKSPKFTYPIAHLSRWQMIQAIPKELVNLLWFCRVPRKDGAPCGVCKTCRWTVPLIDKLT